MAKERKVVFSLEVVEGDGNKQAFANTEAGIKAATEALKQHTAARKEYDRTNAASSKRGGRAGGTDGFSRGMDRADINAAKQSAADERRERERGLADMQRAAQREKQILADRVRANVEASRQIREAARQANADSWRRRQSASGFGWLFGHQSIDQSCPFCAFLRRLQYSCRHPSGCSWLYAWHCSRIRRHY
jgi:hypothetical protein